MKVLVLNGSPRRGGAVSQMLDRIVENLGEACEVEYVFVGELAMKPCTGCMRCRSDLKCVLPEDDAHRIAEAVREADALVVGSPCYWGNMNGWLKVLFDRIVYAMMGEKPDGRPVPLHKGKRAVLVTSCNRYGPSVYGSDKRAVLSGHWERCCDGAASGLWEPLQKAEAADAQRCRRGK